MISAPWLDVNPQTASDTFQGGLRTGAAIAGQKFQEQQSQQDLELRKQELAKQEEQMAVQNELARQKMTLATQSAARQFQAQQDYQNAITNGLDPSKAAMTYGPAMSGGRMTGYSPIFTGYQKANAPPPPAFDAKPIQDPATGKVIGYADKSGNVRYIPQPKAPAPNYETVTDTTPGTQGIPGVPAVQPSGIWPFRSAGAPAIPAIPGTPTERTTRRIAVPVGPPAPDTATTNQDDPLGLFTK